MQIKDRAWTSRLPFALMIAAPTRTLTANCMRLRNGETWSLRITWGRCITTASAWVRATRRRADGFGWPRPRGIAGAQVNLGNMYYHGHGVDRDYEEAARWFHLAAAQGHGAAQNRIGETYLFGYGVDQDDEEATRWFRMAERSGYPPAGDHLDDMFARRRLASRKREQHREARDAETTDVDRPEIEETVSQNEAAREGSKAPDFNAETLTSKRFKLYDHSGMPVLLNFWATWCLPCVVEMPHIQRLHEEMGDSIRIVGVNQQESPADVRDFLRDSGLTFTFVLDPKDEIGRLYGIESIPVSVFIDAEGMIAQRHESSLDYETFLESARKAIGD